MSSRLGSSPSPGARGPDGLGYDHRLPDDLHATAVYRPKRFHAHGGLGEVLAAHQEELDRTVALKRIRPDRLHETARRRFLREATITARLQHPGIVPIYGLGQDEDGPFYTMPFMQGQTLNEAIAAFYGDDSLRRDPGQRTLKFRGLLQRFIAVCNTVAYAHDQGVVHRDLKPSNIMLGPYGETLVMDWGLAKRLETDEPGTAVEAEGPSPSSSPDDLTATGVILGTPQYMSPEQAKGEPASPASDLFSLGLVMYAILTGKAAFEASSFRGGDPLKAVREAAVVPPRSRDPRVPRALEAICLKALAAQPKDRYPSPRAMADDLSKWLADEPVTAYREPWPDRARRWSRKHRTMVASAAAVGVLGLLGSVGFAAVVTAKNRELAKQTQRAVSREQMAIDAVKRFRDVVVEEPVLKNNPALGELRNKLLKEPLAFFHWLRAQLQADNQTRPEALARLADAAHDYAHLTEEIGDIEDGLRSHVESLAIWQKLVRDHPAKPDYWRGLAAIENCRGGMLSATGHSEEAMESHAKALAIRERLARENSSVTEFQRDLAESHHNIGKLQSETGAIRTRRWNRTPRHWRSGSGWRARIPAFPSSRATWR